MTTSYAGFWGWVDRNRQAMGLSWRELETRAKAGNGVLADRAKQAQRPTIGNMTGIARALGLPLAEVMRQAGFITSLEDREPTLKEILEMAQSLTVAERRDLLRYIRFQYGGRAAPDVE